MAAFRYKCEQLRRGQQTLHRIGLPTAPPTNNALLPDESTMWGANRRLFSENASYAKGRNSTLPDSPNPSCLKNYCELHSPTLKKERWQKLARCLSDLRKPESSDVILTCGDRELYAHKIVLEASSPYFVAMFNVGLDEAKSGRILFKEMEPEILDIILDFMYLGDVDRMNSEELFKKVLVSAHLLQLKELFEYCCGALELIISAENFSELWQIGLKYEHEFLTSKVMEYVHSHLIEISQSIEFLALSLDQIQLLLLFGKDKAGYFDEMLRSLVKWLIHDPDERTKLAGELFAYIDIKSISKPCIISLLENTQVMKASVEIANRMNELGVAILINIR